MDLDAERFRALARSSPWRWWTLRFVMRHGSRDVRRVWVRRPNRLRVETIDGELVSVHVEKRSTAGSYVRLSRQPRWRRRRLRRRRWPRRRYATPPLPYPHEVKPTVGADGLVRERPSRNVDYDSPHFSAYYGVAVLDPVELADGWSMSDGSTADPVMIDELRAVDHHGRVAWEGVLRPTPSYQPRCDCCALLLSEVLHDPLVEKLKQDPGFAFPEAYRVRLDVGTGVCVELEEIGGSRPGRGHEIVIEAVDEPMADELFETRRKAWRAKRGVTD
jgi:hypothetical protein